MAVPKVIKKTTKKGRRFKKPRNLRREIITHGQYKTIDETPAKKPIEFEISLKNLPYSSEIISFGAMEWTISVKRNMLPAEEKETQNNEEAVGEKVAKPKQVDYIAVTLRNNTQADLWKCKAIGSLSLKKYSEAGSGNEKSRSAYNTKFVEVFHKAHQYVSFNKFAPYHTVAKSSYASNGKMTICLSWKISKVDITPWPVYDFHKPTSFSDVVLKVGGKEFHVNKGYLAMHSVVFDKLFNGEFAEKNKAVVPLLDIHHKIFKNFLDVIYPSRKKIELLADRYDVPMLKALCEEFMMKDEGCPFTLGVRLQLADRYNLVKLKGYLLRKIDAEKIVVKIKDLPELSKGMVEIMERKTEYIKAGKEKPKDDEMETD